MQQINFLFFSLKGRGTRAQFWAGCVAIMLGETLLALYLSQLFDIPIMELDNQDLTQDQWMAVYDKVAGLSLLVNVIFLWPWIAVIGKRAHDRNKSALWTLFAYVPIIGNLWSVIELGFLRGTKGANRFGPDPLGAVSPSESA